MFLTFNSRALHKGTKRPVFSLWALAPTVAVRNLLPPPSRKRNRVDSPYADSPHDDLGRLGLSRAGLARDDDAGVAARPPHGLVGGLRDGEDVRRALEDLAAAVLGKRGKMQWF